MKTEEQFLRGSKIGLCPKGVECFESLSAPLQWESQIILGWKGTPRIVDSNSWVNPTGIEPGPWHYQHPAEPHWAKWQRVPASFLH